jgi:hypothetical protein
VEKRHFFRRTLTKIAENCDHNIDPRRLIKTAEFCPKIDENGSLLKYRFSPKEIIDPKSVISIQKMPIQVNLGRFTAV